MPILTADQVINSGRLIISNDERRKDLDAEFDGVCYYNPKDNEFIVVDEENQTVYFLNGNDDEYGEEIRQRSFEYYVR